MTQSKSILIRAQALKAEARRLGDSAKDKEDALRVANEVDTAEKHLDALEKSLAVAAVLRSQHMVVDLTALDEGLDRFVRHAGTGLPSWKAVQSASATIKGVNARVSEALRAVWWAWTTEAINALPTDRLSLLGHAQAGLVNKMLEQLRAARSSVPEKPEAVTTFIRNRDKVNAELSAVEDPGPHLRAVLQQVQDGTTLAELSDDDIAVLRQRGWANHIVVRRANFE